MPSNDILVLVAELAVAIAGFSSVVVALGRRPVAEWLPGEQRNLRILLQVSAIAILFSLFPLILQRAISTPAISTELVTTKPNEAIPVFEDPNVTYVVDTGAKIIGKPHG